MSETSGKWRTRDGATGWLVLGALGVLGAGVSFLTYMADAMRGLEGSGGGRLLVITMLGVGMFGAVVLGPIGKAIGKRLLDGGSHADEEALLREVDDLRLQSEDLRQSLAEIQERLDFTERMLSSGRERAPEELH
jgi:hypothetical protein